MKSSLQFKIGLSYLSIIAVVLIILNTYPLIESQNLVFRSKETSLNGSVKVIESALSGLSSLTESNVEKALSGLEETGASRVLVTDTTARVLYDTRQQENARGQYAFYTEIAPPGLLMRCLRRRAPARWSTASCSSTATAAGWRAGRRPATPT